MRVLWITVFLTFLAITVESKNGWHKGKGGWGKHKDGDNGYHKHPDDGQGTNGGNSNGNGQGTNGGNSNGNGQGTNGGNSNGNGQGTNGGNSNGNGQGTNGGNSNGNGQDTNGNSGNNNGQSNGKDPNNGGSNGQTPRPPPSRNVPDKPEEAFQELAKEVIDDDKYTSQYCQKNQVKGVTEIYGTDFYKLIIPLGDDDPDNIQIKIKHRVIYIKGETPEIDTRWSSDNDNNFSFIKALPGFLDITKATWEIKNVKLIITIPYKFKFNSEQPVVCENNENAQEIVVPQGGLSRGTNDVDNTFLQPKKDDEKATIKPIDPNILDKIFGR